MPFIKLCKGTTLETTTLSGNHASENYPQGQLAPSPGSQLLPLCQLLYR